MTGLDHLVEQPIVCLLSSFHRSNQVVRKVDLCDCYHRRKPSEQRALPNFGCLRLSHSHAQKGRALTRILRFLSLQENPDLH